MPWHLEAKKDVLICEKLGLSRYDAFNPRYLEWGNPVDEEFVYQRVEFIACVEANWEN